MILSLETSEVPENLLNNLRLSRAKLNVMYALAQDNDESEMAHIIFKISESIDDAIIFLRKISGEKVMDELTLQEQE